MLREPCGGFERNGHQAKASGTFVCRRSRSRSRKVRDRNDIGQRTGPPHADSAAALDAASPRDALARRPGSRSRQRRMARNLAHRVPRNLGRRRGWLPSRYRRLDNRRRLPRDNRPTADATSGSNLTLRYPRLTRATRVSGIGVESSAPSSANGCAGADRSRAIRGISMRCSSGSGACCIICGAQWTSAGSCSTSWCRQAGTAKPPNASSNVCSMSAV